MSKAVGLLFGIFVFSSPAHLLVVIAHHLQRLALGPITACVWMAFLVGATHAHSEPITVFYDEQTFLAAAGGTQMESFEGLSLGTVSGSFKLSGFTVTADQNLQVLGASISPYSGRHGAQALITYDYTTQAGLSTEYGFMFRLARLGYPGSC